MDGIFRDRRDAGEKLGNKLKSYVNRSDVIVLGLARGGIPVAFEVASALNAPLDVFIVRKIGVPGRPELAMGAIASGGSSYLNEELIGRLGIPEEAIASVVEHEKKELKRREDVYRMGDLPLMFTDRKVILVDDGLATGASMRAAVAAVRKRKPKEIIVAVPVIAEASINDIARIVDHLVYVLAPLDFYAVGQWYSNFGQTSDEEVQSLVNEANRSDVVDVRS